MPGENDLKVRVLNRFMNAELAVIGGTGFALEGLADEVETPFGRVPVVLTRMKNQKIIFISRHGIDHIPPHKVNYRAIISAAKRSGATRIISTNTVGSMADQSLGSIFLPADFVEFTKSRINTFFEEKAVHVDMSQPYCPELCAFLAEASHSLDMQVSEGVYVCAEGPHLESPAQVRMMSNFGDVVGMTGYPEVVLAKEAQLCYASLCVVTNPACGMAGEKRLEIAEITDLMKKCQKDLREIIRLASQKIPCDRACSCQKSLTNADF
jgi:5'-methylthioadenosine phosphorylase